MSRSSGSSIVVEYDDQAFVLQERGGISRIYSQLIEQFATDALGVTAQVPMRWTRNRHLLDAFPNRFHEPPRPLARQPLMRIANRVATKPSREAVDVLHHTYYFGSPARTGARVRFSSVYDMIPERFPTMFGALNPHREKAAYVRASDGVICISETTKADLLREYGQIDAEVFVVPLGVDDSFRSREPRPAALPWPYLLYVGQRNYYKDFHILIDAFGVIARRHPDLRLVACGGEPWRVEDLGGLPEKLHDRVIHLRPNDRDLPAIYQHAATFVSTSRYEGFGLPVAEALACGVPTVVTDIPSHHEVADEAATYYTAEASSELAEVLNRVLVDDAAAHIGADLRRLRSAEFSWRRVAGMTADAYRSLL